MNAKPQARQPDPLRLEIFRAWLATAEGALFLEDYRFQQPGWSDVLARLHAETRLSVPVLLSETELAMKGDYNAEHPTPPQPDHFTLRP